MREERERGALFFSSSKTESQKTGEPDDRAAAFPSHFLSPHPLCFLSLPLSSSLPRCHRLTHKTCTLTWFPIKIGHLKTHKKKKKRKAKMPLSLTLTFSAQRLIMRESARIAETIADWLKNRRSYIDLCNNVNDTAANYSNHVTTCFRGKCYLKVTRWSATGWRRITCAKLCWLHLFALWLSIWVKKKNIPLLLASTDDFMTSCRWRL